MSGRLDRCVAASGMDLSSGRLYFAKALLIRWHVHSTAHGCGRSSQANRKADFM